MTGSVFVDTPLAVPAGVPQDPLAGLSPPQEDVGALREDQHAYEPVDNALTGVAQGLRQAVGDVIGGQWLGPAAASCGQTVDGFAAAYTEAGTNAEAMAAAMRVCAHRWEAALERYAEARRLANEVLAEEARYRQHAEAKAADLESRGEAAQAGQVRAEAWEFIDEPHRSRSRRMAREAVEESEQASNALAGELNSLRDSMRLFTRAFGHAGSPMLTLLPSIAGLGPAQLQ